MRVAALSLSGLRLDTLEHYREDLITLLRKLKVRLAVLPAHTAFVLYRSAGRPDREPDFRRAFTVFCEQSAEWNSSYLELHAGVAGELGLYLAAGSTVETLASGSYHTAYCFDPSGKICAAQRQTHLSRAERELGLSRGVELPLFQVDGMTAGLLVATDARHPEVGRILSLRGADILVHTGALEADRSTKAQQLAGMWAQVQQNQCWAVEAQLHAEICGRTFSGASAVLGPCITTGDLSGYLALAAEGEPAAAATLLKQEELLKAGESFPVFRQINPGAYRDLFEVQNEQEA